MQKEYKEYRVTLNVSKKETLLSGLFRNLDARFNSDAGVLLSLLSQRQISIEDFSQSYPQFFSECIKNNWITGEGEPNYHISVIDTEYHLKRIQIELTRLCNLSCPYCYSVSGPSQKTRLTTEKIFEFIDDAYDLGCIWVDFTGGEPLAYKGWDTVLKYANAKGLVCSLHTNGTLLTESNVDKLKNIGIRHIQTSLDSHKAEVHDSSRRMKGAFEKTLRGIKRCQDIGISTKISIVAHTGNKDHYVDAVKYFREVVGSKVLIDRVIKAGGELSVGVGLSTREYFNLIQPIIRDGVVEAKVCDNFVVNDIRVEPHCGVAHSFLYITADGEYALCPTMTSRDDPIKFSSPTMDNYSLKEAWENSPYVLDYRGLNCRNTSKCPTAKDCGGGCRSNAYIETGELDSPDFLSCNAFKNFTAAYVDFSSIYNSSSV